MTGLLKTAGQGGGQIITEVGSSEIHKKLKVNLPKIFVGIGNTATSYLWNGQHME